ncbi:hypothetical protein E9232_006317 [Inquilinus ginsengisoli]|uniref:Ribbon-helix-helix protein CopG domain-containing protein n=1 Tax=Inquilinus ginsengisoli TaxID=363840 RepID=A0ABU1K1V3_9PROT|nr:hypothetical protein [Inquilinus ginsengisoli]MDR6293764.1 hypothetical protein [Inquilinus ginsengisoli]
MTSRKRAGLDLDQFEPRASVGAAKPGLAAAIAREEGFVSRSLVPASRRQRRLVRQPIDITEELRAWLKEEAHRRDVTIRAVILDALKNKGAPVDEDDLVDRRRTS